MEDINPAPSQQTTTTNKVTVHRSKKAVIFTFLAICFVVLGTLAGYYYGKHHNQKTAVATPTTNTVTQNSSNSTTPAKAEVPATHYVIDKGTPFDLKKEVTVSLGIPSAVQGVQVSSGNNNRGLEQYLTDKYNDEIGRWIVSYPDTPPASESGVSVLAVGDSWLKATQSVDSLLVIGADVNTPTQKAKYLADLNSSTQSCAQNPDKGFVLKDKSLSVCYDVIKSKYGNDGVLSLKGYGVLDKRQIVLLGTIGLPDVSSQTVKAWTSSLSQTTVTVSK